MVQTESPIQTIDHSDNQLRSLASGHCGLLGALALMLLLGACGKDNPTGSGQPSVIIDTLFVAEDAHIQSDMPDGQYGTAPELSVVTVVYVGGPTVEYRSLIKLPPLPDSVDLAKLNWAKLILHYTGSDSSRFYPVSVYALDSVWDETSVSWNNAPAADSLPFDSSKISNHILNINVANVYRNGDPDRGVMLRTIDGTEQVFHSSEAAASETRPIVEIGYRVP